MMNKTSHIKNIIPAGLFIGIGMGGFLDGIMLHQILQTHSMLSNIYLPNTLINVEINMFWDGLFHVFTWIMTAIGIWYLWRANQETHELDSRLFLGFILIGFGLFNTIEGIIDHFLLQLHHVIQFTTRTGHFISDLIFLFSGIILIFIGGMLIKKSNDHR